MLSLVTVRASVPHLSLRRLRVGGASLACAAAILIAASGTTFAWSASSFSAGDERLLFSLTNQDRASVGLNALVNDSYLHKEAEWRAKDMGDRDYFSHQIPPGNNMVFTDMQHDGYCFKVAGENIGLSNYDDNIATASIEKAFMGSKPHRENILGTWGRLGVGAYKAADGSKIYYAVLFSVPCGAAVKSTPKPTPKPTHNPTATPTSTPLPTATPTASSAPSASDLPTVSPSAPTASSTPDQIGAGTTPVSADTTSLRVHEKSVSQSPIDSLFHSLFGGMFGW
jgi:uncharacterized protein YkwD